MTGTHAAKVNEEKYGNFLKQLNEVDAYVYKSLSNPFAMGLQGGKKLYFAKNVNIYGTKCIKLNEKPNTTSTETSMLVVFNDKQAGIPNVGNQLHKFGTAISTGDLPSIENCTDYSSGKSSDTGGQGVSTWGCITPLLHPKPHSVLT